MTDSSGFTIDIVQAVVQTAAFLLAGVYFEYRIFAGWMEVKISLDINTERVNDPVDSTKDLLGVVVTLTNGDHGLIRICDAIAVVSFNDERLVHKLHGTVRYDFRDDLLVHGKPHPEKSRSGFAPGQKGLLSTHVQIPKDAVCLVDVTILAHRKLKPNRNESRSCTVSLPAQ
ncbi:MAG TPA: hypothetical protein VMZ06_05615 [Candidatus Bathyarchaeia archaeon]|nr:hypothetical protein [Candidatus Bathyarchaeia archaeon]